MSVLHLSATADILLLYPGESLGNQLELWSAQHLDRQIEASFERSLPEIRRLLRRAGIVLIDATEDPSQAADAFLQAVTHIGADAVVMYTEKSHPDLEVFVRMRGSLFVLGPLFEQQWGDLIAQSLRMEDDPSTAQSVGQRRQTFAGLNGHGERLRARFGNRFRDRLDWPFTGGN